MESEAMKKYKAQEAKRVEINLRHLENGVEFVDRIPLILRKKWKSAGAPSSVPASR